MGSEEKLDSGLNTNHIAPEEKDLSQISPFFKSSVDLILDPLKCPNCDELSYIDGECLECGLGLGDYVIKNRRKESVLDQADKIISIVVMGLSRNIYYHNEDNRIEKDQALLEFEVDGEIYKINIGYSITKSVDRTDPEYPESKSIRNKDLEFLKLKGNRSKFNILKKVGEKWVGCDYPEKDAISIAKSILLDTKINKTL